MDTLKMFGFPVVLNTADMRLLPQGDGIGFEDYSRKFSKAMFGLLADADYRVEDEPYYDFYKAIGRDADRDEFTRRALRYDSTVILPGAAGNEYKKTAGHFHCEVPGQGMSYPELYQVVHGKALFVMQKVQNENAPDRMLVENCILAEVHEGQTIVVPPNYGHCTVNIGSDALVFVNLVAQASHNAYDGVKRSSGMCCYVLRDGKNGYRIEKNPHYDFACEPRLVKPVNNDTLGVHENKPAYTEYLREPDKYSYLTDPATELATYFKVFKPL